MAFPTILTPYGISFLILLMSGTILLMSGTNDHLRETYIVALFLAVMVLNWIAMRYAQVIIHYAGTALAVFGAVLSVLQVALAVQIMIDAVRALSLAAH